RGSVPRRRGARGGASFPSGGGPPDPTLRRPGGAGGVRSTARDGRLPASVPRRAADRTSFRARSARDRPRGGAIPGADRGATRTMRALGEAPLTLADLVAVARGRQGVTLATGARAR